MLVEQNDWPGEQVEPTQLLAEVWEEVCGRGVFELIRQLRGYPPYWTTRRVQSLSISVRIDDTLREVSPTY
jgi:hypothetical protein